MTSNPVESRRPELTAMFEGLIRKAQPTPDPPTAEPAMINIVFDGAGQPLTVGMGGILQIPYPCRILSATMFAGTTSTIGVTPAVVSANVFVGLSTGSLGDAWANGVAPLYGTSLPAIVDSDSSEMDVTSWVRELQPYDIIAYALTSFTGTATLLNLGLLVKKLDIQGLGIAEVLSGSDNIVSGSDRVVFRT